MIHLKEIDEANLEQCEELERKSNRFVGNSFHVLAEAYVHRISGYNAVKPAM